MMRRYILLLLLFLIPCAFLSAGAQAEKWDYWDSSVEGSNLSADHSLWQAFLDDYLDAGTPDGINRLDYSSALVDGEKTLTDYISLMESLEIRKYSSSEQFAYWVNLYNSVTVKLILDNYPVKSIRKISDPWGKKLIRVEGEALSLDDIEHRILRPIWQDPRIHFAVNCASLGCPNLAPEALTPVNTERILEIAAGEFIGHSRGAELRNNVLVLSSIFDWYKEDFGADEGEVLDYIRSYSNLDLTDDFRVKYEYDWDLNDISK